MPLKRFAQFLERTGRYDAYVGLVRRQESTHRVVDEVELDFESVGISKRTGDETSEYQTLRPTCPFRSTTLALVGAVTIWRVR